MFRIKALLYGRACAALCVCMTVGCVDTNTNETVSFGDETEPGEVERFVRERQNLTYFDSSNEFHEVSMHDGGFGDQITVECPATCPSTLPYCEEVECILQDRLCKANILVDLASADVDVTVGDWRIPPQTSVVRSGFAVMAQTVLGSGASILQHTESAAPDGSCDTLFSGTLGDDDAVTYGQHVLLLLRETRMLVEEASNAATNHLVDFSAQSMDVLGLGITELDVRLVAARHIVALGIETTNAAESGLSACGPTTERLSHTVAEDIVRESGVAPAVAGDDSISTFAFVEQHVLRRLAAVRRQEFPSIDSFLASESLTLDDFAAAREALVEQYSTFLRDVDRVLPESVVGADGTAYELFAATRNEPSGVPPALLSGRAINPGDEDNTWTSSLTIGRDWLDAPGGGGLADLLTGIVNYGSKIVERSSSASEEYAQLVRDAQATHEGWFFAGAFSSDGSTPAGETAPARSILAYTMHTPSDLVVVDSEAALRCLTTGQVEGTSCSLEEFDANVHAFESASETDYRVQYLRDLRNHHTFGAVANVPGYSWAAVPIGPSTNKRQYVLRRRSGAAASPGAYMAVGMIAVYNGGSGISRGNAVPSLIERAGRLLSYDPSRCADFVHNCGTLTSIGNIPLEVDTNDNGNGDEDSWRTYLALARQAAQEADMLGREAADAEFQIVELRQAAANRLEDICGGPLELEPLIRLAEANPTSSLMELVEFLPSSAARLKAALTRCLGDSVVDVAAIGDQPLCLWRSPSGQLCGLDGDDTTTTPCPSNVFDGVCTEPLPGYEAIHLNTPEEVLGIFTAPEPDGSVKTSPSVCNEFRELRSLVDVEPEEYGEEEHLRATELWLDLFANSRIYSAASAIRNAAGIRVERRPGDYVTVVVNDRPLIRTGGLVTGPGTSGVCASGLDEVKVALGCTEDQEGTLLCGSTDCNDHDARAELNHRLVRAGLMARWLGQAQDHGFVDRRRTLIYDEEYARFVYTGDHLGRTVASRGDYWCTNTEPCEPYGGNQWLVTEMYETEGFEYSTPRREEDQRRRAYSTLEHLRQNWMDTTNTETGPYRSFWAQAVYGWHEWTRVVGPGGSRPWNDHSGATLGLRMDKLQVYLDGLELLCYSGIGHSGTTTSLPDSIPPEDVGQVAALVEASADRVLERSANLVVEGIPEELAIEFGTGAPSSVPLPYDGELGTAASRVRDALLALNSAPAQFSEQLDGVARDLRQIESAIRISELRRELSTLNFARTVVNEGARCAIASMDAVSKNSESFGFNAGPALAIAAITCAAATANVAFAASEMDITSDIDVESDHIQLVGFVQNAADRASSIRQAGDAIVAAHNELNAALNAFASLKAMARREAGNALYLTDAAVQRDFQTNARSRNRLSIAGQRYNAARENAIYMADLARRAIEQRFGIHLSELGSDMSLVSAPASWVDDLCGSRGISYNTDESDDSQRAPAGQFVGDYVDMLSAFTESYRIDFPYVDGDDRTVVSLRDDVLRVTTECDVPSLNRISHSASLAESGAWHLDGCAEPTNCIHRVARDDIEGPDGLPVSSVLFGPNHPDCPGDSCPCADAACGWSGAEWTDVDGDIVFEGPSLRQSLRLSSGVARVVWNVLVSDPGVSAAAPDMVPEAIVAEYARTMYLIDSDDVRYGYFDNSDARDVQIVEGASGETWLQFRFVVRGVAPGVYTASLNPRFGGVGVVPAGQETAAFGGVSVVVSRDELDVDAYVAIPSTNGDGTMTVEGCRDVDGDAFRNRHWSRNCVSLCEDGFSNDCDPAESTERCYYETTFAVAQSSIDDGELFGEAGFALGNFNYRWRSVALNFVGSGLRDCRDSASPLSCYSGAFVPYSIEHLGPYPVRGHFGVDRHQPLFPGRIEHARGLASERFLTNPISSTDRADVHDYMQTQFRGRPLTGRYKVRVWEDESFRFEQLEDVQLVVDYGFWTRL